MDGGVADDTALAHLTAPSLELRLDKREQPRVGLGERERRFQYFGEANETGIANYEVDQDRDVRVGQDARAGLFEDGYARVLADFPRKLVGAAVDREDVRRATGQQHVGESAGRGADVDRHRAGHVPAEVVEAVRQLDAAARHPRMVTALDGQRCIDSKDLPCLFDLAVTDIDQAREDQRLRPGPAFGESEFDKPLVGARLRHQASGLCGNASAVLRPARPR